MVIKVAFSATMGLKNYYTVWTTFLNFSLCYCKNVIYSFSFGPTTYVIEDLGAPNWNKILSWKSENYVDNFVHSTVKSCIKETGFLL